MFRKTKERKTKLNFGSGPGSGLGVGGDGVETLTEELVFDSSGFGAFPSAIGRIRIPSQEPGDKLWFPCVILGNFRQEEVKMDVLTWAVQWLREKLFRTAHTPCLDLVPVGGVSKGDRLTVTRAHSEIPCNPTQTLWKR